MATHKFHFVRENFSLPGKLSHLSTSVSDGDRKTEDGEEMSAFVRRQTTDIVSSGFSSINLFVNFVQIADRFTLLPASPGPSARLHPSAPHSYSLDRRQWLCRMAGPFGIIAHKKIAGKYNYNTFV